MEIVLHEAGLALQALFTPLRMGLLLGGVMIGLISGVIPGLGGITALSLLLPFTFGMDPYSAMAILMGLAAAVSHGDVIPAVLFGVPGTVGCAATVMDGYPMAKRGEAGRALGAAFSSSLIGGLFGAMILGVTIPVISPVVLFFGSPELLAICVFGMTLAASLSGNAPMKGFLAALIGLLLSMIGEDQQTSTLRFTFDTLYLWNGMPIVPIALGVFAIPELCDLMINRKAIASTTKIDAISGQWQGWKDSIRNWFLVIRTGALGAVCSMVPGLGAPVIDWIAYGHAIKTEKGAGQTFGKGDVRGVIAAESSTNAREGGALVTTIAFGVPGHPSMAILLGAFLIQGITPGPLMLTKHLDVTYTIVWSLTLANVFGTLICFAFANQFGRLATLRYTLLLPTIMALVYIGAFEGQHDWGDIISLLIFGTVGWIMKRCGWSRPPLVLGFVLGKLIERYMFISVQRYGWEWLTDWFVMLMFGISFFSLGQQIVKRFRSGGEFKLQFGMPTISLRSSFALVVLCVFALSIYVESGWPFAARLMPMTISVFGIFFAVILLFAESFGTAGVASVPGETHGLKDGANQMLMDLQMDYGDLTNRQIYSRALEYFVWIYGVLIVAYLIGFVPALVLSTLLFLRFHGREKWSTTIVVTAGIFAFLWLVFDRLIHETWPPTLLGDIFPTLREISPWF
jgi:putative tricarboxylic transport membrane protein